jgi:hypothetical protein
MPSPPHCFRAGTRLVTIRGEVPVERVEPGDLVLTLSGEGAPLKPVVWTGRVEVNLDSHPDPLAVRPVRLAAGAVEPGMPIRDLVVSPDHGLLFEDDRGRRVLVPAGCLVNGATVTREPARGIVAYHHVEVDGHDVLMADGMAAESFPPGAAREAFGSNVVALTPRAAKLADFTPAARAGGGAPYLVGAAAHPLHARLLRVALDAGFALTDDPGLALQHSGGTCEAIADAGGEYVFLVPPGVAEVTLRSRRFVPAEVDPTGGDGRTLGVALARVVHDGEELDLAGEALGSGFLPAEGTPGARWRWSLGAGTIALSPRGHETTLEVTVRLGWGRYWLAPTPR